MPRQVMNPFTGRFDTVVSTLDELTNVTITSITDRDRLIWDSASNQWVNLPSVTAATHEPGGFENRTDSVLAFDSGTREFSITAAVTDWKIWVSGERITLTGPDTDTIAAATGTTYFYYDSAGVLQQSNSFPGLSNIAIAASIYWNNATGDYLFGEERHGITMDWATHSYLHATVGAAYKSGGDITRTLSDTTLAGNQIALTETVYADEDIDHTLAAWVAGTTWQKWYIDASGNWLRLATDNNLLGSNVTVPNFFTAAPVLGYNDTTSGTIAIIGLNDYVNVFVLGTNDKRSEYRFIVLCGQANHANTSSAYAETIDSLSFGNLPIPELKPLYQLTYQRVNTGIGCQMVRSLDIRKSRALGVPSASASTHNALSGLQGGAAGEYYHLTATDYANVVAVVNSSGIDIASTLNVGATNATEVNVGNVANTVTTNIYGATINIGQPGGTVNLLGAVNNINATDVFVPNDLEVDGVIYADGGIDRSTAATLAIGATNATQIDIGHAGVDNYLIGNTRFTGALIVSNPNTFTATGPITIGATAAISVGSGATITGTLTSSTLAVTGAVTWNTAQSFPGITLTGSSNFGSVTIAGTPTWSGVHVFDPDIDANGSYTFGNEVINVQQGVSGGGAALRIYTDGTNNRIVLRASDISGTAAELWINGTSSDNYAKFSSTGTTFNVPVTVDQETAAAGLIVDVKSYSAQIAYGRTTDSVGWGVIGANSSNAFMVFAGGTGAAHSVGSLLASVSQAGAVTLGPSSGLTSAHFMQNNSTTTGDYVLTLKKLSTAAGTNNTLYQSFQGSTGTSDGYIGNNGSAVLSLVDVSDARKKENVRDATYGLDTILKLRPVEFDWKDSLVKNVKGFIAQEVELVLPESVVVFDESAAGGFEDAKYLETQTMIPVLVKALQELKQQLDETRAELAVLKGST